MSIEYGNMRRLRPYDVIKSAVVELSGSRIASFTAAIILSMAAIASQRLEAAEPPWPSEPYDYIVLDQDLRTVLEQFGFNTGLRVVLSDAVQGRVHGRLPLAPPRQFFSHLTEIYGLDWYYDGASLDVSEKSESRTDTISLNGRDLAELRSELAAAGLLDERYTLRPGSQNAAIASGPPQYLAMIKQFVASMSPTAQPAHAKQKVMIIRGSSVTWSEFQ